MANGIEAAGNEPLWAKDIGNYYANVTNGNDTKAGEREIPCVWTFETNTRNFETNTRNFETNAMNG